MRTGLQRGVECEPGRGLNDFADGQACPPQRPIRGCAGPLDSGTRAHNARRVTPDRKRRAPPASGQGSPRRAVVAHRRRCLRTQPESRVVQSLRCSVSSDGPVAHENCAQQHARRASAPAHASSWNAATRITERRERRQHCRRRRNAPRPPFRACPAPAGRRPAGRWDEARGRAARRTILASTANTLSPQNASRPVRHSNSTQPSENTSALALLEPRACSGAMMPGFQEEHRSASRSSAVPRSTGSGPARSREP